MSSTLDDFEYLKLALRLAARARGRTSPNPMVGCVIVKSGRVVASGYHHRAGAPHAEIEALRQLGMRAPGATAYVTLEPCDHVGRTGPCTDALIEAKIARVVIGMRDPNPRVDGRGMRRLGAAGIRVEGPLIDEEARALNRAYIKWVTTGRPFVTLKAAVTLDGRLAARGGDARWVSGERSRLEAHRMRDLSDAILVGARTVERDDPELTTRLAKRRGKDPLRVILDGRLSISPRARALPGALVVTTRAAPAERAQRLSARGAEVLRLPGARGRVRLDGLLSALGARGVCTLLVEGGGDLHGQLLASGLADEMALFIAPKLVGAGGVPLVGAAGPKSMAEAWRLTEVSTRRLGEDILVVGAIARSA